MSSNTYVEAEIWTVAQTEQGNVVLVRPKGAEVAVPIFIGQLETQSILIGLGKVDVPRPLTHDLLMAILRDLGIALERIEICDLRDGTFFSRLILSSPGGKREIDARPSDAIALAVRVACPVYIAEQIVEDAGIPIDSLREAAVTGEESLRNVAKDSERERLRKDLEEAIAEEDYERAATIRDRLKLI